MSNKEFVIDTATRRRSGKMIVSYGTDQFEIGPDEGRNQYAIKALGRTQLPEFLQNHGFSSPKYALSELQRTVQRVGKAK